MAFWRVLLAPLVILFATAWLVSGQLPEERRAAEHQAAEELRRQEPDFIEPCGVGMDWVNQDPWGSGATMATGALLAAIAALAGTQIGDLRRSAQIDSEGVDLEPHLEAGAE